MKLSFKKWLETWGSTGGQPPPKQDPTKVGSLGFADFHGKSESDPENPEGKLPPTRKRKKRRI